MEIKNVIGIEIHSLKRHKHSNHNDFFPNLQDAVVQRSNGSDLEQEIPEKSEIKIKSFILNSENKHKKVVNFLCYFL